MILFPIIDVLNKPPSSNCTLTSNTRISSCFCCAPVANFSTTRTSSIRRLQFRISNLNIIVFPGYIHSGTSSLHEYQQLFVLFRPAILSLLLKFHDGRLALVFSLLCFLLHSPFSFRKVVLVLLIYLLPVSSFFYSQTGRRETINESTVFPRLLLLLRILIVFTAITKTEERKQNEEKMLLRHIFIMQH